MSKQHEQEKRAHQHQSHPAKKAFHRDWRLWVVVGLMLGAMAIYVATLGEAVQPDVGEEVSATAQ